MSDVSPRGGTERVAARAVIPYIPAMLAKLFGPRASKPPPVLPRVPEGTRLYAIGDIHGRLDLLTELERRIAEDAASAGAARKVIVYLGDYLARGSQSREVVERLIDRPLPGF